MAAHVGKMDLSTMSDEEIQAQDLIKRGEIDEAIAVYQKLKPDSARVFSIIGVLYANHKADYDGAINYFEKALQIQEENDVDASSTLTDLGFAYQNCGDFNSALTSHFRALSLRQLTNNIDRKLVASNLFGIANAYWGQKNLSEALSYAEQALTLNKSIESGNDSNIATNLAILANIYYHCGDDIQALELAKQALNLFEGCGSPDSAAIDRVLNNLGTIQVAAGLFNDALVTFVRLSHIFRRTLPKRHPKRVAIGNIIQQITDMQYHNGVNSFSHLWQFLSKIPLL